MFNGNLKKEALDRLRETNDAYQDVAEALANASDDHALELSRAADTKWALAWLDHGTPPDETKAKAHTNALLAASGPIGWTTGDRLIIGGALFARYRNKSIAREANARTAEIEEAKAKLQALLDAEKG